MQITADLAELFAGTGPGVSAAAAEPGFGEALLVAIGDVADDFAPGASPSRPGHAPSPGLPAEILAALTLHVAGFAAPDASDDRADLDASGAPTADTPDVVSDDDGAPVTSDVGARGSVAVRVPIATVETAVLAGLARADAPVDAGPVPAVEADVDATLGRASVAAETRVATRTATPSVPPTPAPGSPPISDSPADAPLVAARSEAGADAGTGPRPAPPPTATGSGDVAVSPPQPAFDGRVEASLEPNPGGQGPDRTGMRVPSTGPAAGAARSTPAVTPGAPAIADPTGHVDLRVGTAPPTPPAAAAAHATGQAADEPVPAAVTTRPAPAPGPGPRGVRTSADAAFTTTSTSRVPTPGPAPDQEVAATPAGTTTTSTGRPGQSEAASTHAPVAAQAMSAARRAPGPAPTTHKGEPERSSTTPVEAAVTPSEPEPMVPGERHDVRADRAAAGTTTAASAAPRSTAGSARSDEASPRTDADGPTPETATQTAETGPVDRKVTARVRAGTPDGMNADRPAPTSAAATGAVETSTRNSSDAGPVRTEAPASPVRLPAVSPLVAAAARTMRTDGLGRHRLTVRLDPPELGQVDLDLIADGDDVRIVVRAASQDAAEALGEQRARLAVALREQGFALDEFEVQVDVGNDAPTGHRADDESRSGRNGAAADADADDPATEGADPSAHDPARPRELLL